MMEVAKAMGLDGRRCCLLDTFLKGASIRILVPMEWVDTDPGFRKR